MAVVLVDRVRVDRDEALGVGQHREARVALEEPAAGAVQADEQRQPLTGGGRRDVQDGRTLHAAAEQCDLAFARRRRLLAAELAATLGGAWRREDELPSGHREDRREQTDCECARRPRSNDMQSVHVAEPDLRAPTAISG